MPSEGHLYIFNKSVHLTQNHFPHKSLSFIHMLESFVVFQGQKQASVNRRPSQLAVQTDYTCKVACMQAKSPIYHWPKKASLFAPSFYSHKDPSQNRIGAREP